MSMCLFSDIIPTWDVLKFDAKLSEIPCVSRGYNKINPLDKNVVIRFEPDENQVFVYYLPRTNKTYISNRCIYGTDELSRVFRTKVDSEYRVERTYTKCVRPFVTGMILGESYVFRRFEVIIFCDNLGDNNYVCRVSPVKEVCRYVFYNGGMRVEDRNKRMIFTTVEEIPCEDVYDTLQDADESFKFDLVHDFKRGVNILHKEEILRALQCVNKSQFKLGFNVFLEVYAKATEKKTIYECVPTHIIHELNNRVHIPNTAVRIDANLVVVTGEIKCKYFTVGEQVRVYFDKERGYYFRRNLVTGNWKKMNLCSCLTRDSWVYKRIFDKEIFYNTCIEKYAEYSVEKSIPSGRKVDFGSMLAQFCFLAVEQAAKTDENIYQVILEGVYKGWNLDLNKSLPDLFEITGGQLKFLKDIPMPPSLEGFAKCMTAEDFKLNFPDVKKRIFAVAFYLNRCGYQNGTTELTKEEIFAAAKTLNALEKCKGEKREQRLAEYRDYLKMCRVYRDYVSHLQADSVQWKKLGDFRDVSVNVKPSKIAEYHNRIGKVVNILKRSELIARYSSIITARKEKEAQQYEYIDEKYSILMPKDAEEIIREGWELQHCVGSAGYIEAVAEKLCVILFLRDNRNINAPFFTIEVRDGSIRQCYGYRNSHNKSIEIRDFIMKYAAIHHFKVVARICSD